MRKIFLSASLVFLLSLYTPMTVSAESFDEFECDFSGVLESFPDSDFSCDKSIEEDGSFDISCDYSYDDEAQDISSSGSFDASCELEEENEFECDASVSYDYDSPSSSISKESSCDTVGSNQFLSISCGTKISDPILKELINSFNISCGVPQKYQDIVNQLIDDGDTQSVKELTKDLSGDVKNLSSLSKRSKKQIRRNLRSAFRLTKRKRSESAKQKISKVEELLVEANLSSEEQESLCAGSLFCVF